MHHSPRRRLLVLLIALGLIAAPATVMRVACWGDACAAAATGTAPIPFCSLPRGLRTLISNGFNERRSPNVIAVSAGIPVGGIAGIDGSDASGDTTWPDEGDVRAAAVPIVLSGHGIEPGLKVDDLRLEDIAAGLATVLGIRRDVLGHRPPWASLNAPRLIVEIVWEGVGSEDLPSLEHLPALASMLGRGTGTLRGTVGSLPLDPVAVTTTLGVGAPPSEHGVIGSYLRSPYGGHLVRAWSTQAPAVLPTLAQDLDRATRDAARIGLVAPDPWEARGLVGSRFYTDDEPDRSIVAGGPDPDATVSAVEDMLARGFGSDGVPDLLAVVLRGSPEELDGATARIVAAAEAASGGAVTYALASTGSTTRRSAGVEAWQVQQLLAAALPGGTIPSALTPEGLFLPPSTSASEVADALRGLRVGGARLFADAFPAFAIELGRYC
jgi:hypothetical protein